MNKRKLGLVALIMSVTIAVVGGFYWMESGTPLYQGNSAYRDGRYEQAIAIYSQGLKQRQYATDPRYYRARANVFVKLKQFDKAISDFDKALELAFASPTWSTKDPKYGHALTFDILLASAWAHLQNNEPQVAVEQYTEAFEQSTDKFALIERAQAYKQLNQDDKARADIETVLQMDKGFERAIHERGLLSKKQGDLVHARADLDESIKLNGCQYAYCDRALLNENESKFADALRDYTSAINKDPKFERAYHQRALLHLSQGRVSEAQSDIAMAEQLDPTCKFLAADKSAILAAKSKSMQKQ